MTPHCSCGDKRFETTLVHIDGFHHAVNLIHCKGCGTVVGSQPEHDPAETVELLADYLNQP